MRVAQECSQHRRKDPYIVHRDGRLEDTKRLASERRFAFSQGSVERDYLDACTKSRLAREAAAQEERERRVRDAEQLAEEAEKREKEQKEAAENLRRAARKLQRRAIAAAAAAAAAVILLIVAVLMWRAAQEQAHRAQEAVLAVQNALTDSFFRTIGVSKENIPMQDEREAL